VRIWSLLLALPLACSSGLPSDTETPAPARAKPELPTGSLGRTEVVELVDEGLGSFLQRVSLEPSLEKGRFQGFRIVSLQPADFWSQVDLQAGDVVTQVNGKSIEVPESAFEIFESLRTAAELRVWLVRDGKPKELVFPIVGAPAPKPAANSKVQPSG
jgi:S1-C subfamily serine protease